VKPDRPAVLRLFEKLFSAAEDSEDGVDVYVVQSYTHGGMEDGV
jgi:hypothetical protein